MSRIVVAENGRQKAIRAFSEMYVIAKVSQEKTKYFEIKFRKLSVLDKQSGLSAKCMSMQRSAIKKRNILNSNFVNFQFSTSNLGFQRNVCQRKGQSRKKTKYF